MVDGPKAGFAERRVELQAFKRLNHLLRIRRTCFFDTRSECLDRAVADHRAQARIVFVFGVIGDEKRFMGCRVNPVPRVARDKPAFGCFVTQRVDVFRLASEQAHHFTAFEEAARVAFAYKAQQVGTEEHVENRVRLGVAQCLHNCTSIHAAQWSGLLGDEFDVGLRRLHLRLEGSHRRLPVFIVRVHNRPALFLQLRRFRHQHRGLHVGRWAQAEGVAVAALPDDPV